MLVWSSRFAHRNGRADSNTSANTSLTWDIFWGSRSFLNTEYKESLLQCMWHTDYQSSGIYLRRVVKAGRSIIICSHCWAPLSYTHLDTLLQSNIYIHWPHPGHVIPVGQILHLWLFFPKRNLLSIRQNNRNLLLFFIKQKNIQHNSLDPAGRISLRIYLIQKLFICFFINIFIK